MPIKLEAYYDDGKVANVLEVVGGSTVHISEQAVTECRIKFTGFSMDHGGRHFLLRATPANAASLSQVVTCLLNNTVVTGFVVGLCTKPANIGGKIPIRNVGQPPSHLVQRRGW